MIEPMIERERCPACGQLKKRPPGRPYPPMDPNVRAGIVNCLACGYSMTSIARRAGISRYIVAKIAIEERRKKA